MPYRIMVDLRILTGFVVGCLFTSSIVAYPLFSAQDLRLAPNVSFYQDIDSGFPIVGDKMDDVALPSKLPAFVFFGASGDLNTNRQARRVVDLYERYGHQRVKFIIIDVDHPVNADARSLIKRYYPGYIPSQILINKDGESVWSQVGEVDLSVMQSRVEKLL